MDKEPSSDIAVPNRVYTREGLSRELRQGEIIANLTQYSYDSEAEVVKAEIHQYCIVATQDCDLLQDFEPKINNVLLYEAKPAAEVRTVLPAGSDIWKRVIQNKDERYHLLETISGPHHRF